MTSQTGHAIISELKGRGISATWEHPGYVSVTLPRVDLDHGTPADEDLEPAELYVNDINPPTLSLDVANGLGEVVGSIESDLPRHGEDVQAIASFIQKAIAEGTSDAAN